MTPLQIIKVENIRKSYDKTVAVDDVTFQVHEGEIFGMVGPNGAGKTTTIECIEGLRTHDQGQIQVLGVNPQKDGYRLRPRIGIQLQETSLQDRIKVWEALDLYRSFYPKSLDGQLLMEQLGLADHRDKNFTKLSGGQKQRLFIALALIHDPELIFLDELTTGLDPHARHAIWDLIQEIRDRGKTIFLTTHFMEEAERLCDRVAIMDHGRIVAIDTPENLIREHSDESRVVFTVLGDFNIDEMNKLKSVDRIEAKGERIVVCGQGDRFIADVVNTLTTKKIPFRDLRTEHPNLEDVFLNLTGRELRD